MKNFLEEFRRFCAKGNVLELATGVMIGGAFSSIVNSLVNDILMPLIGLLTGGVDLSGLFVALDFQSYPSRLCLPMRTLPRKMWRTSRRRRRRAWAR